MPTYKYRPPKIPKNLHTDEGNESDSEGETSQRIVKIGGPSTSHQPAIGIGIGLRQQKRSMQYGVGIGDSFRTNPKLQTSPRGSVHLPESIKGSKRSYDGSESNLE